MSRNHDPIASAPRTVPTPPLPGLLSGLLLILVLGLAVLPGCAPGSLPGPEQEPPRWDLTPNAEAVYQFLLLEDARRRGDDAQAAEAMDALLELVPSPRIFIEAANLHWRRGDVPMARAMLLRGMERFPGDRDLAVTLATTYFAEKRYDHAAETLRGYLERNPEDWDVRQELAAVLIEQQQYAEALDIMEAVPETMRTPTMLYHYAKAASKLGRIRQAIAKLKQAVEGNPGFVEAWAELAYQYEMAKDYLAAEQTYTRILELGETGQEIWLRLISLNLRLNNPDKALELYAAGPDDPDFSLEAATLFLDQKFFDQAATILEPLAKRSDAPAKVHFYLAVLAFEGNHDVDAALAELARIPADDPHHERAFRFRIHLLIESGRTGEALELVRQGQADSPDPDFWLLESRIHEKDDHADLAREVLEKALQRWPENTDLLYSLGILQDKEKQRDVGIATMERIIAIDPDHADALNYVGYTLADLDRDLDRALVLVRRALELKPDSGYIVDSLAWVLFRMRHLDEAWREIVRAVEMVGDEPTVWEHYGDIAAARGQADEARKGYRKSLEIKPSRDVKAKLEAL